MRPSDQNPVLELIAGRLRDGSRPEVRSDSARLALVVEGGGMRGVVASGMVTALDQFGVRSVFDMVVGTSAGALAGAFFLAGDPALGTSICAEDLVGREWVDYRRVLRREPVVGLDFLIDEVMVHRKPLQWDAVIASPAPLHVVAARLPDFAAITLGDFTSQADLREALRATASIPAFTGPPVRIDGHEFIDGFETHSIPVEPAVRLGATHILALLTRPAGVLRHEPNRLEKAVALPLMNRVLPGLGDAHAVGAVRYAQEVERLRAMHDGIDVTADAYVIQIPPGGPHVRPLEQDPEVLYAAAAAGGAAVNRALTGIGLRACSA